MCVWCERMWDLSQMTEFHTKCKTVSDPDVRDKQANIIRMGKSIGFNQISQRTWPCPCKIEMELHSNAGDGRRNVPGFTIRSQMTWEIYFYLIILLFKWYNCWTSSMVWCEISHPLAPNTHIPPPWKLWKHYYFQWRLQKRWFVIF